MDHSALLHRTADHAAAWLDALDSRPVGLPIDPARLRERLGGPLPQRPLEAERVLDELVYAAGDGLVTSPGPRYFGFVVGGTLPAALAADWMTSAWDQVAGAYVGSPSAAIVEEVCEQWVVELLDLPAGTSLGLVTGTLMATFTALSAARFDQLGKVGWDVARRGVRDAPPISWVMSEERHSTVDVALRYLGVGADEITFVATDRHGAARADAFVAALEASSTPTIAVAHAGNVNTGAVDPLVAIGSAARRTGAWLHIDGAFGLWARVDPHRRGLVDGLELADSWATDGHKWLNLPYDNAMVLMRSAEAHRRAMTKDAAYAMSSGGLARDPEHYVPEFSRRARGFPLYAALRSLGREGIADLISRDCDLAQRFATGAGALDGVSVVNDVVLNQVLLRFEVPGCGDEDALSRVLHEVHAAGVFWAGRTTWRSSPGMRVSISGWRTTEQDVDAAVASLGRALEAVRRDIFEP